MKAVILAGGRGTRLAEETSLRPKPMVEIGGKPVLWHLMKSISTYGITEFVVCAGYKGYMIKEYFANYFLHTSDFTVDLKTNDVEVHATEAEPWRVSVVDTGERTETGGRLLRIRHLLDEGTLLMTYGDGLANVDIDALRRHHEASGCRATVTAVQPPGRYGALRLGGGGEPGGGEPGGGDGTRFGRRAGDSDRVLEFREKPADGGWVSGGFFLLERAALDLIRGDQETWETGALPRLAHDGQLGAYRHTGFWHPCDTLRDKLRLDALWDSGQAPWRTW